MIKTTRYNPALANLALAKLAHAKTAFVSMGPNAQIATQNEQQMIQQAQQQQQPQQAQQMPQMPQADPMQGQAPQADPSQQAAPQPSHDDIRAVMREELAAHDEKPKKLSVADRLTHLEGLVVRMLEHNGLVKPDQALLDASEQPPAQQQQPDPMAAMQQQPQMPTEKVAAFKEYLHDLLVSNGYMLTKAAYEATPQSDAPVVGRVYEASQINQPMPATGLDPSLPPVFNPGIMKQAEPKLASRALSAAQQALSRLRV